MNNFPSKERIAAQVIIVLLVTTAGAVIGTLVSLFTDVGLASALYVTLPTALGIYAFWRLYEHGYLSDPRSATSRKHALRPHAGATETTPDPLFVILARVFPPPKTYDYPASRFEFLKRLSILYVPVVLMGICVFYPDPPESSTLVLTVSVLSLPYLVGRERWKLKNHPITCDPFSGLLDFHEKGNVFPWFVFGGPPDPFDIDGMPLETANQNLIEQFVPWFKNSVQLRIPDATAKDGVRKIHIRNAPELRAIKEWRAKLPLALELEKIRLLEGRNGEGHRD